MISGCFEIILFLLLFAMFVFVGVTVLPIIALLFLIKSYIVYKKNINLSASKMQCPNCNSNNVKITSLKTGSQTQSKISGSGSNIFGITYFDADHNSNMSYTFKREALCSDCGFNFDYLTDDDVNNIKKKDKTKLICSIALFAITLISTIPFLVATLSNNDDEKDIWASEYTPLEDFDYYLDGNQVYLKEYNGKSKRVKINNIYEKDGKQYYVIKFADEVFAYKNVISVILPEGLKEMPADTFRSCEIKYIYIPASLKPNDDAFYSYFHDVEAIYYGGTENDWNILTNNANRTDIDAKEIKYNTNISNLTLATNG